MSTDELNAGSTESRFAESASAESESDESTEFTETQSNKSRSAESEPRVESLAAHNSWPVENSPCNGDRQLNVNIPSAFANHRIHLSKTQLLMEVLTLKHLAENLYQTAIAFRSSCMKKLTLPTAQLSTLAIDSPRDSASSLLCTTEVVIGELRREVKIVTQLERLCWRHVTLSRKHLLHPLRDLELLLRTTHCNIYNSLGSDKAQLCGGSGHRKSYSSSRRIHLRSLNRHQCGRIQCEIARDIQTRLKQLVEMVESELPHRTTHQSTEINGQDN